MVLKSCARPPKQPMALLYMVYVARVFTLACADEHLLRNLESLVAVQIKIN